MNELEKMMLNSAIFLNQGLTLAVSVIFTIIAAYVAGLYYVLRHAGVFVRVFGFFLFVSAYIWMTITALGVFVAYFGWVEQRERHTMNEALPPDWTLAETAFIQNWLEVAVLWFLATVTISIIAVTYLTFWYKWPDQKPIAPSSQA